MECAVDVAAVIVSHSKYGDGVATAAIFHRWNIRVTLALTAGVTTVVEGPWENLQLPNVGYGSAINAAVLRETQSSDESPDWLLILNDDFQVNENWTDRALNTLAGLPNTVDAVGFDASPTWSLAEGKLMPKGSCFAVRWKSFVACGGFDPIFFLYFEETDLLERLGREGDIALVPLSGSRHIGSSSTGRAMRSGFQLVSSACEYRKRHHVPMSSVARWFLLTAMSSITSRQFGHVVGLFIGALTWRSFSFRERLSEKWFGAAPYAERRQYSITGS